MLKRKDPVTVDYIEVEVEDPEGVDHTFQISTTGDTREPWLLTGIVLNGHVIVGPKCWAHFETFKDLASVLQKVRKGRLVVSSVPKENELHFTELPE